MSAVDDCDEFAALQQFVTQPVLVLSTVQIVMSYTNLLLVLVIPLVMLLMLLCAVC